MPKLDDPIHLDMYQDHRRQSSLLKKFLARLILLLLLVVNFPKFDQFVISCEQLGLAGGKCIYPLDGIYFLRDLS